MVEVVKQGLPRYRRRRHIRRNSQEQGRRLAQIVPVIRVRRGERVNQPILPTNKFLVGYRRVRREGYHLFDGGDGLYVGQQACGILTVERRIPFAHLDQTATAGVQRYVDTVGSLDRVQRKELAGRRLDVRPGFLMDDAQVIPTQEHAAPVGLLVEHVLPGSAVQHDQRHIVVYVREQRTPHAQRQPPRFLFCEHHVVIGATV